MEIKERIEQAQVKLKQAEQAKTVAEESAKKECDDIIAQMETLDVTPENIDAVISQLETEVDNDLTAIEQAIPTVQ